MTAYLISEVTIVDDGLAGRYRELAAQSIARHGGTYLARGGRFEQLEGQRDFQLAILVSFPSFEQAEGWYASADYAEALALSRRALMRRLYLLDGVR